MKEHEKASNDRMSALQTRISGVRERSLESLYWRRDPVAVRNIDSNFFLLDTRCCSPDLLLSLLLWSLTLTHTHTKTWLILRSTLPIFTSNFSLSLSLSLRLDIWYEESRESPSLSLYLGSGRLSVGLTVPRASNPNSLNSSWNNSQICETSRSSQHLSVPTNSLRPNRHSDGNIALSGPTNLDQHADQTHEQLLDPRLIPNAVRRSLLALHRESQENIHVQRPKEKTQSENDVHGAFTPWKIKMKSKLKRTHHRPPSKQLEPPRPQSHSRTLSFLSARHYSNDGERRVSEYATSNQEQRFSTPPPRNLSVSTTPIFRRSLRNYPKYLTQSTSESEATPVDLPSIFVSVDDDTSTATVIENDEQASLTTS